MYETATTIINDVLAELALGDAEDDPYTSTSDVVVRLRALLTTAGRYLVRQYAWSHLQTEHLLSTVDGQATYSLPSDFARTLPATSWDRSASMPLTGPLTPEGWQAVKALPVAAAITYFWRVKGATVLLSPTPSAVESLALEYVSKWWVQPSGEASRTTDRPTAGTDTLHFDPHLLTRLLKLRWLEAAGFPSEAAQREYEQALSAAQGGDGASPVLSLNRPLGGVGRLLDGENIPETGFGA